MSALTPHPSLFDAPMTQRDADRGVRGKVRRTDPATSRAAAQSISQSCEQAIRDLFGIPRSLTDDAIAALLPEWYPPTVKSARSRLSAAGFLKDSGDRKPSARNRNQIVWTRST